MIPTVPFGALVLTAAALTGCAGLGESDFACPGYPSEPLCLSTAEVYRLSLSGEIPRPVKPRKDDGRSAKTSSEELF